jgi:hypothetical protein
MDLITIDRETCRRDSVCREVCPFGLIEGDREGYPVLRTGGECSRKERTRST